MTILAKLLKNTTRKHAQVLSESIFFSEKDVVSTSLPMINVALSGTINGGLTPGVTTIAGPSKHFKTGFALLLAGAYMKKYPEAALLFYDSEFGTPQTYFDKFGIDSTRVLHTPISNVEDLKHDMAKQLSEITRNDRVIIVIDSIGNLASKKELVDALEGKEKTDMTRAKALKSFFRMFTADMTIKNIPMICVNHTYNTMEMYSKAVVGGGTGGVYGSDNIWILGRQQDKESGKELEGYHFIINVEKSRYVKEKSKIPISLTFDSGISRWSGLFDLALEMNYITKAGNSYVVVDQETGELGETKYKKANIENNASFWQKMLADTDFPSKIAEKYRLPEVNILVDDDVVEEDETESV